MCPCIRTHTDTHTHTPPLDPRFPAYRTIKPLVAVTGGCAAALLTFPSFRFARAYASSLVVHREAPATL